MVRAEYARGTCGKREGGKGEGGGGRGGRGSAYCVGSECRPGQAGD